MHLTDKNEIRARLNSDRSWAIYALGDLDPVLFAKSNWYGSAAGPAVALVFRGFDTGVLVTLGTPAAVAPLLDEIGAEHPLLLHIRPDILPLIQQRFRVSWHKRMRRMVLDVERYERGAVPEALRLGPAHLGIVQTLYADGKEAQESPDCFAPAMLQDGVFFGIVEGTALIAAAGTHLVAPAEGVAAVGNIYTRRDCRGRGLAHRCTRAVVNALLNMNVSTIALNVHEENAAALRVYEDLGFVYYCDFIEGLAMPLTGETS